MGRQRGASFETPIFDIDLFLVLRYRAYNSAAKSLFIFVKLHVGIRSGLDLIDNIDDCRALIDGLVPDIAAIVVVFSSANTRH